MTVSRGLHLSASDCAELLRRHDEHVGAVLEQMSLMQLKPSLDDLRSSADCTHLSTGGINLVSVDIYVGVV